MTHKATPTPAEVEMLNMCAHGADIGTYCGYCLGYSQGNGMSNGVSSNAGLRPPRPNLEATILALEADKAVLVEALEKIVRVGDWNNYVPDLRNIARAALAKHGLSEEQPAQGEAL